MRNIKIVDANIILRYLINDNKEMAEYAETLIKNSKILITPEVIAEVVYVLKSVYKQERENISSGIIKFMNLNQI